MLLSIIVPVFNMGKFLEKCLLSALDQDLPAGEFEILVLDDGSTDDSLSIAEKIAAKHENIRVFTHPNQGLSLTRNRGMEESRGDYLCFLDSDDYLAPGILGRTIREKAEQKPDMLMFEAQEVDEQGQACGKHWKSTKKIGPEPITGRDFLISREWYPMVWVHAFRREFLIENGLKMVPLLHEDEEFTPRALSLAKRFLYIPETIYFYVQHSGSITHNIREKNSTDLLQGMKSLSDFTRDRIAKTDPEAAEYLYFRTREISSYMILRSVREGIGDPVTLLRLCRRLGLEPFHYPIKGKKRFLFHLSILLFLHYCKKRNMF